MDGSDRHSGPFRLVLHYLWYSPSSSCLPLGLVRLAHKQVLAINGKLLAVVQDQCVEIRSVRDDFGSIIGKCQDKEQYYPLEDVSWWSDVVLILARCSGSVTVSSVRTLRSLLGKSCEWFEPSPRVTAAHEVGFLSLEYQESSTRSKSLEVERTDEAMQVPAAICLMRRTCRVEPR
ncbi:hypothetical protein CgunFtcFv8_007438 [Champsocephalus gunnari]|uniref:Neuroblastoma-amplified sequence N-terminal domain-containing protein n=1 Tax=Champsocephalus gunnari TaxID=52237 RepID=A0AAN8H5W8_CHAGU|nr:hypothetical protein CgunFtcFv8_007438 [Champsocephalus gunnari]